MSPAEQPLDKSQRRAGERLALDVGMRMSVSLDTVAEEGEERIAADLVGMIHFEYLVLRLPWIPGLRPRLVTGAMITVRFISEGVLCGFQGEIITHVGKPSLLLFLSYPNVVEKLALRQHKRIQCALPAQIHSRRGDAKGLVMNLSHGGVRLLFDVHLHPELRQSVAGDEMVLRLNLDADGVPKVVTCSVRSVEVDAARILLGTSFTEKDQSFDEGLQRFLEYASLLETE